METTETDVYEDAMNAEWNPTRTVFGEVQVDVWACVLVKGSGKVPFDPNQHSTDQRQTAIKITIQPLPGSKTQFATEREMIAASKEWTQYVRPSLRALDIDLKGLNGKWVQAELAPTGRTYINKSGEEKQATALKFVKIFRTMEECLDAADALFGGNGHASAEGPAPEPENGNERATATKFLPALWQASNGDLTVFAQKLATTPLVSKYFDISSKEVLEIIGK